MKKLILSLVWLLAFTSFSFASLDSDIEKKYNQLSPIVNLILTSEDFTVQQKSLVKTILSNCAETNKNEVIKRACVVLVDDIETEEEIAENEKKFAEESKMIEEQVKKAEEDIEKQKEIFYLEDDLQRREKQLNNMEISISNSKLAIERFEEDPAWYTRSIMWGGTPAYMIQSALTSSSLQSRYNRMLESHNRQVNDYNKLLKNYRSSYAKLATLLQN
jgi:hypothetical protein